MLWLISGDERSTAAVRSPTNSPRRSGPAGALAGPAHKWQRVERPLPPAIDAEMQMRCGGAGVTGIAHEAQHVAGPNVLAGHHQLLIKVGIVEVFAVLGSGQPHHAATQRGLTG